MRIDGPNRTGGVASRAAAGKAGSGPAFVPAGGAAPARVASAVPVSALTGLDAILALQTVGDFRESRRKSVKRGTVLLDLLEDMKADLLVGKASPDRLGAMITQLSALRERSEPSLDAVLDDIELRVRVELAKHGHYLPL
ncbi:flagellar assembly protein FliX [Devosia aurantiaca]|uniref:Flagellar assembly protein FliX n=1 Tax=Devosia aurantiaca TaxID=2714858 RepID=A0A6M1SZ76_9HYPH|nr:flagellar assembly protein FliX [Devosia aurantiaca]NGP17961.1 hypothetical protein [Devosia aurantiaca]